MNKELSRISQREFNSNEFMVGDIKNGIPKVFAGTLKKRDLKIHFEKLKGVLR